MKKKKTYKVIETITQTTSTEYLVDARSEAEARKTFKENGQYCGDYTGSGPDRVKVKEITELDGPNYERDE